MYPGFISSSGRDRKCFMKSSKANLKPGQQSQLDLKSLRLTGFKADRFNLGWSKLPLTCPLNFIIVLSLQRQFIKRIRLLPGKSGFQSLISNTIVLLSFSAVGSRSHKGRYPISFFRSTWQLRYQATGLSPEPQFDLHYSIPVARHQRFPASSLPNFISCRLHRSN